ncbi:PREDICTED: HCLS1-associated protein X-1 isoform X3 [Ficedula albicollis]|uniref:HCLS1-associated protein X-1 isoform X3 n=1 Tax=Ficedula albicollis TaxID=59894 RepID=UPI0007AD8973|nr:PREDICTED: HCLS1-associated protein X-1 isoform X3 [Ficedula albicollis]
MINTSHLSMITPLSRRPRDPLFGGAPWDEEEEEEDGGPPVSQPPQDFGFGFSPGSSRGAFEELFRDMSELLGALGGFWAEPQPPFEPALPGPGDGSARRPLRDSMLKQPMEDAHRAPPALKEDQGAAGPWQPWGHGARGWAVSQGSALGAGSGGAPHRAGQPGPPGDNGDAAQGGAGLHHHHQGGRAEEGLPGGGELAQFAGTWPQQDELRSANPSDPSSLLGSFFRRWFSSR